MLEREISIWFRLDRVQVDRFLENFKFSEVCVYTETTFSDISNYRHRGGMIFSYSGTRPKNWKEENCNLSFGKGEILNQYKLVQNKKLFFFYFNHPTDAIFYNNVFPILYLKKTSIEEKFINENKYNNFNVIYRGHDVTKIKGLNFVKKEEWGIASLPGSLTELKDSIKGDPVKTCQFIKFSLRIEHGIRVSFVQINDQSQTVISYLEYEYEYTDNEDEDTAKEENILYAMCTHLFNVIPQEELKKVKYQNPCLNVEISNYNFLTQSCDPILFFKLKFDGQRLYAIFNLQDEKLYLSNSLFISLKSQSVKYFSPLFVYQIEKIEDYYVIVEVAGLLNPLDFVDPFFHGYLLSEESKIIKSKIYELKPSESSKILNAFPDKIQDKLFISKSFQTKEALHSYWKRHSFSIDGFLELIQRNDLEYYVKRKRYQTIELLYLNKNFYTRDKPFNIKKIIAIPLPSLNNNSIHEFIVLPNRKLQYLKERTDKKRPDTFVKVFKLLYEDYDEDVDEKFVCVE